MAPRDTAKVTPKVQRTIVKNTRVKPSPVTKKTISIKDNIDKVPSKVNHPVEASVRTNTVPTGSTQKSKENNPSTLLGSVSKLGKNASWKRRPKPAHSGVPVPEKMKKLLGKQLQDLDCSLETAKVTLKVQHTIVKNTQVKESPVTKKTISTKDNIDKALSKVSHSVEARVRTNTVPKAFTQKSEENKPTTLPGSVSKFGKKALWKRRPKPAHSGVPVPEKMKKLLEKQLQDLDCSL